MRFTYEFIIIYYNYMEWFSDDKYVYSIAMMFAYINLYKPKKN